MNVVDYLFYRRLGIKPPKRIDSVKKLVRAGYTVIIERNVDTVHVERIVYSPAYPPRD